MRPQIGYLCLYPTLTIQASRLKRSANHLWNKKIGEWSQQDKSHYLPLEAKSLSWTSDFHVVIVLLALW
jgi:mannose/cellobiose epimerase-like protein (N-acyl-D-glucosamine 2-epimerase family)